MEELVAYQEDKLERLSKAYSNYKKSPKERLTKNYIETKLENIEKSCKEFCEVHRKIVTSVKKESKLKMEYFTEDFYGKFETCYEDYKIRLKEDLSVYLDCPSAMPAVSPGNEIKLPRIELPKFAGNYGEWQTFYDMFVSLIHTNSSISAVQKLHYLKSNLTGEAEKLLKNLSTTESNYQEAWSQLTRRYNNKRYNTNEILRTLFSQKPITTESSYAIKTLLDTTVTCLKSLDTFGIDTKSWDLLTIYLTTSKLDPESRRQWEVQVCDTESDKLPTWDQMVKFLENRFRTLEMIDASKPKSSSNINSIRKVSKSFHSAIREEKKNRIHCVLCSGAHILYQCKQFNAQTPEERVMYVQSNRLCFNCLAPTHNVRSCHQSTCCHRCGRRHHTILHLERGNSNATQVEAKDDNHLNNSEDPEREKKVISHFTNSSNNDQVLLATASVQVKSKNGDIHSFRALLDQGSQASFITETTVQFLGIKKTPVSGIVFGVGESKTKIKNMATFNIQSYHDTEFSIEVNAFILSSLTSILPEREIPTSEALWPDMNALPLADPHYATPGRIHILLGAEVYSEILLGGIKRFPDRKLIAQNTRLGWIVSGRVSNQSSTQVVNLHITSKMSHETELLKKFWEIEQEPESIQRRLTNEEKMCEEFYEKTTSRDNDGRYIVKFPFKEEDPQCLYGESQKIAQRRFNFLEKKLMRDPKLCANYAEVLQEYVDLNHMKLITEEHELNNPHVVYLPHHAVIRNDKQTTRLRIVWDASSKGVNNVSLNDCLGIGPKLQQDLRHILMRWRCHPICLVADIVKMYRQVLVHNEDTKYQRLLWRSNHEDAMQHYELLRLSFGMASSPYLAVKTLQQLAKDEQMNYPKAALITLNDFYMDDMMSGCQTEEEAMELYEEINNLMKAGGFELQKWCTNSQKLKEHIIEESQRFEKHIPIKESDTLKVLGICWNKISDCFEYTIQLPDVSAPITKRKVLSDIARLYDPMGWIAPVIITAKIFIQKLWKARLEWDDELPSNLLNEWINYKNSLMQIEYIVIPRWLNLTEKCEVQLHAFSDASSAAYAGAVYMKVIQPHGKIYVNLITAKTKVAPIEKEISIPRLELCGALLATKLLNEVAIIMKVPKQNLFAWTDSTVVLAWLRGLPNRWTTFVSNRVSEILNMIEFNQWAHVPTNENPADAASRGLSVKMLTENTLWWNGPDWLQTPYISRNSHNYNTNEEEKPIKRIVTSSIVQKETEFLWLRFSSLPRMLRVLSYCKRVFSHEKPNDVIVKPDEINNTLDMCIRLCQEFYFAEELKQLKLQHNLSNKNPLHTLHPFLDEKGILRVGGRIERAQVDYDQKHPIIIPSKTHFTNLLITDAHLRTLHGGPQLMLNYLRSKYWILRAREQVKKFYRNCVPCVRHSKSKSIQLMGQLPEARVKPSRPFKSSGVDFTGAIKIRFSPGRGSKSYKGYICLFVCMATRAIHLEPVSDLTAQGFINAFRRFVSRRGHCSDLFSDNGTNFLGACKVLQDMHNRAKSQAKSELEDLLAREGTVWHFIPAHAPNFGGLWEAGVRSVKSHLKRVIGESTLTFEELYTVLTEIEACVNSRPLTLLSDNSEYMLPLTPGHFLVGEPLITIPNEDLSNTKITGLNRWLMTQKMVGDFWKRWADEYLVTLNQRYKWATQQPEPNINDIVLIREDNLPPAKWLLAKVVEKHPGKDNITRVVTLKTKNGLLKRPCNKLCLLPKDM